LSSVPQRGVGPLASPDPVYGVVTVTLPVAHDPRPPRVGVQKFLVCRSCENRCSQNIENRRFAGKY
jgi:hypothetical protein